MTTGEREEIDVAVDSGAGETVVAEDMLESVAITESEAQKKGVRYEAADGTLLPNCGEKRFEAFCEGGAKSNVMWGK